MKSGAPRGERSSPRGLMRELPAGQLPGSVPPGATSPLPEPLAAGVRACTPVLGTPSERFCGDPEQSRWEELPPGLQAQRGIQLLQPRETRVHVTPRQLRACGEGLFIRISPWPCTPPFTSVCAVVQSSSPIKAVTLLPLEPLEPGLP